MLLTNWLTNLRRNFIMRRPKPRRRRTRYLPVAAYVERLEDRTLLFGAPVFDMPGTMVSLPENQPAGTPIATMSAHDPDGGTLTWNWSYAPPPSTFILNTQTGQITTAAPLDYEQQMTYMLQVRVTDDQGESTETSVTVNLMDVDENPHFTNANMTWTDWDPQLMRTVERGSYWQSVAENQSPGTVIADLNATTQTGAPVTFHFTGTSAAQSLFQINAATGVITAATPLDFESCSSYSLSVEASSGVGNVAEATVNISVTDVNESPHFTNADSTWTDWDYGAQRMVERANYMRTVVEGQPAGTQVLDLNATGYNNAPLTYRLVGAPSGFQIDAATGVITTTGPLDGSTNPYSSLVVEARDAAGNASQANISINVQLLPRLAVYAPTPNASEPGSAGGMSYDSFQVMRTGDTSQPLTVHYSLSGTATAGSDYTVSGGSGTIVFSAGQSTADVMLSLLGDMLSEGNEDVWFNLVSDPAYRINSAQSAAEIVIQDMPPAGGGAFPVTISGLSVTRIGSTSGTILPLDAVHLMALCTDANPADQFSYVINWGDGSSDSGNASAGIIDRGHTYTHEGSFNVQVTATSTSQSSSTASCTVQVQPVTVTISGPPTAHKGSSYTLGLSTNADGDTFLIDWGEDGSDPFIADTALSISSLTSTHTYSRSGTFTIRGAVHRNDEVFYSAPLTVTVINDPPEFDGDLVASDVDEGQSVVVSGFVSDPSGDPLTVMISWDGGDPEIYSNQPGNLSLDLTKYYLDDDPTGTPSDVHTATVTLIDSEQARASQTVQFRVKNVAPSILSATAAPNPTPGSKDVTLTATFNDPALFSDSFEYLVNWDSSGNGTAGAWTAIPANASGFSATHTYAQAGSYMISVQVRDDDQGISTVYPVSVEIPADPNSGNGGGSNGGGSNGGGNSAPNTAPVAVNDQTVTAINTPTTISVLLNDHDDDGDILNISSVTSPGVPGASVSISADTKSLVYRPADGFIGLDTFQYTITDDDGHTSTATVTVYVGPLAYVIARNDEYSVSHNGILIAADPALGADPQSGIAAGVVDNDLIMKSGLIRVQLTDSNPDPNAGNVTMYPSGAFMFEAPENFVGDVTFDYVVSSPAFASVAMDAIQNLISLGTMPFLVPIAGQLGMYSVMAVVPSGTVPGFNIPGSALFYEADKSNVGHVTIHVTNDKPVGTADSYLTQHDTPLLVGYTSGWAGDTTVAGIPILYQTTGFGVLVNDWDKDEADRAKLTVSLVTGSMPSSQGTVELDSSGAFLFRPAAQFVGQATFQYTISDGYSTSDPVTVTIDVVNTRPEGLPNSYSMTYGSGTLLVPASSGVMVFESNDQEGTTAQVVTTTSHGTLELLPSGAFSYKPDDGFSGEDHFEYALNDGVSTSDPIPVTITVARAYPSVMDDIYDVAHDSLLTVIGSDGVLQNDYQAAAGLWIPTILSGPQHGTLVSGLRNGGGFVYRPDAGYVGEDSFQYKLVKDGVTIGPATARISVHNAPPSAMDDYYYLMSGGMLVKQANEGVLADDMDLDDVNLTASLISGPMHGSVTLLPDGSFVYVAADGYFGDDSFTYQATDGIETRTAMAHFQTTPDTPSMPPMASPMNFTVVHDGFLLVPESQGLASFSGGGTVTATSQPMHGTLTLNPKGSFLYRPDPHFVGYDSFTYTVANASGISMPATVTISVTDQPSQSMMDSYSTGSDTPLLTSWRNGVLANDTDSDGDDLTAVLDAGPTHGTLTFYGNGSFLYVPSNGYNGADTFWYHVVGNGTAGMSTSVSIQVGGPNMLPTAAPLTFQIHHASDDRTFNSNSAGDFAAVNLSLVSDSSLVVSEGTAFIAGITDPDGDPVTVTIDTSSVMHGTLTAIGNGAYEYHPDVGFVGIDSFQYRVTDGFDHTGDGIVDYTSGTATINVVNSPPVVRGEQYYMLPDDTLVRGTRDGVLANETDEDGDALQIQLVSGPQNGTLVWGADGSFAYTPHAGFTGTDQITYRVSDGVINSMSGSPDGWWTATATINVVASLPTNLPPTAATDSYSVTHDSLLVVRAGDHDLLANDFTPTPDQLFVEVTQPAQHGIVSAAADGSFLYSPAAGFVGTDTFQYLARTQFGVSAPVTVTLHVTDARPSTAGDSFQVRAGGTLNVGQWNGLTANDSDADGDRITVVSVVPTGSAHGTLTWNSRGGFQYTPDAGFVGTVTWTYQATDGFDVDGNGTADLISAMFSIRVNDTPPTAAGDSYSISHGDPLVVSGTGGILANDQDLDGDTLTFQIQSGVSHGTLTTFPTGGFVYVPNAGFVGNDSFTYTVSDGTLTSTPASVVLHVGNFLPTATNQTYSGLHDDQLFISADSGLLANAADGDGDSLKVSLLAGPESGTVVIEDDGAFHYTPNAGVVGTDHFTFKVTDGVDQNGDGAPDYVTGVATIHITNASPTLALESYTTRHDRTLLATASSGVLANDTDADGDPLTASVASGPLHGTLELLSSGAFQYAPDAGYVGADEFTYAVSDGISSTTGTVHLTVTNAVPSIIPRSYTLLHDQVLFAGDSSLVDGVLQAASLLGSDEDSDGDVLTVSLVSNVQHGTLTLQAGGTFVYVPASHYSGTDSFQYRVSDGTPGGNTVGTVNLTIQNSAPQASNTNFNVDKNGILVQTSGVLSAVYDADGDRVTVRVLQDVQHGTLLFDEQTGGFLYEPTLGYFGTDQFTYVVLDGQQSSPTAYSQSQVGVATINVIDQKPVATDRIFAASSRMTLHVVPVGTTTDLVSAVAAPLTATDPDGDSNFWFSLVLGSSVGGSVSLQADGTFDFTPDAGFSGQASFKYMVTDGQKWSDPHTVTVNVSPQNGDGLGIDPTIRAPVTFYSEDFDIRTYNAAVEYSASPGPVVRGQVADKRTTEHELARKLFQAGIDRDDSQAQLADDAEAPSDALFMTFVNAQLTALETKRESRLESDAQFKQASEAADLAFWQQSTGADLTYRETMRAARDTYKSTVDQLLLAQYTANENADHAARQASQALEAGFQSTVVGGLIDYDQAEALAVAQLNSEVSDAENAFRATWNTLSTELDNSLNQIADDLDDAIDDLQSQYRDVVSAVQLAHVDSVNAAIAQRASESQQARSDYDAAVAAAAAAYAAQTPDQSSTTPLELGSDPDYLEAVADAFSSYQEALAAADAECRATIDDAEQTLRESLGTATANLNQAVNAAQSAYVAAQLSLRQQYAGRLAQALAADNASITAAGSALNVAADSALRIYVNAVNASNGAYEAAAIDAENAFRDTLQAAASDNRAAQIALNVAYLSGLSQQNRTYSAGIEAAQNTRELAAAEKNDTFEDALFTADSAYEASLEAARDSMDASLSDAWSEYEYGLINKAMDRRDALATQSEATLVSQWNATKAYAAVLAANTSAMYSGDAGETRERALFAQVVDAYGNANAALVAAQINHAERRLSDAGYNQAKITFQRTLSAADLAYSQGIHDIQIREDKKLADASFDNAKSMSAAERASLEAEAEVEKNYADAIAILREAALRARSEAGESFARATADAAGARAAAVAQASSVRNDALAQLDEQLVNDEASLASQWELGLTALQQAKSSAVELATDTFANIFTTATADYQTSVAAADVARSIAGRTAFQTYSASISDAVAVWTTQSTAADAAFSVALDAASLDQSLGFAAAGRTYLASIMSAANSWTESVSAAYDQFALAALGARAHEVVLESSALADARIAAASARLDAVLLWSDGQNTAWADYVAAVAAARFDRSQSTALSDRDFTQATDLATSGYLVSEQTASTSFVNAAASTLSQAQLDSEDAVDRFTTGVAHATADLGAALTLSETAFMSRMNEVSMALDNLVSGAMSSLESALSQIDADNAAAHIAADRDLTLGLTNADQQFATAETAAGSALQISLSEASRIWTAALAAATRQSRGRASQADVAWTAAAYSAWMTYQYAQAQFARRGSDALAAVIRKFEQDVTGREKEFTLATAPLLEALRNARSSAERLSSIAKGAVAADKELYSAQKKTKSNLSNALTAESLGELQPRVPKTAWEKLWESVRGVVKPILMFAAVVAASAVHPLLGLAAITWMLGSGFCDAFVARVASGLDLGHAFLAAFLDAPPIPALQWLPSLTTWGNVLFDTDIATMQPKQWAEGEKQEAVLGLLTGLFLHTFGNEIAHPITYGVNSLKGRFTSFTQGLKASRLSPRDTTATAQKLLQSAAEGKFGKDLTDSVRKNPFDDVKAKSLKNPFDPMLRRVPDDNSPPVRNSNTALPKTNCFTAGHRVIARRRHAAAEMPSRLNPNLVGWTDILLAASALAAGITAWRLLRKNEEEGKLNGNQPLAANPPKKDDDAMKQPEPATPIPVSAASNFNDGGQAAITAPRTETADPDHLGETAPHQPLKRHAGRGRRIAGWTCAVLSIVLAFGLGTRWSGPPSRLPGTTSPLFAATDKSPSGISDSLVPIEDITTDDEVWAFDESTGRMEWKPVDAVFRRVATHLRYVQVTSEAGDQTFETTDEHPFWLPAQKEFVKAKDLKPGDRPIDSNGAAVTVVSTRYEPHPEGIPVYNFRVAGYHTYFVQARGSRAPPVLVHNADCVDLPKQIVTIDDFRSATREGRAAQSVLLDSPPSRSRYPLGEPIPGERPLGSPLDPNHHNALLVVTDKAGTIQLVKQIVSGESNASSFERQMSGRRYYATDTEARAAVRIRLLEGETMTILGQKNPCGTCQAAMKRAAAVYKANYVYQWWDASGNLRGWTAKWTDGRVIFGPM